MLKYISDTINIPVWARESERWQKLHTYDLWLEGRFYNHLAYSFYEEVSTGDKYIPISDRRPSVQFNLPNHISKSISRKLFGGRHVPRFTHSDRNVVTLINGVVNESCFWPSMAKACFWGSVGSVAVTFKVNVTDKQKREGKIVFDVWHAKDCWPTFDKFGELSQLRIAYTTRGSTLMAMNYPKPINVTNNRADYEPKKSYWWIKDFTTEREIQYAPIEEDVWNPINGEAKFLHEDNDPKRTVTHNLGFVPGHWIRNLSGGVEPDGCCTWAPALNTLIEADYTLSQLGRGIRYSAAPQLVIKGQLQNWAFGEDGARLIKSPAHVLMVEAGQKDAMGGSVGDGDAKLLETTGQGIVAGLSYYEILRKIALEQISGSRKDPDKLSIPQSGKAMEVLDEEYGDLIGEKRTSYGDEGLLPIIRKALLMAKRANLFKQLRENVIIEIGCMWPKMYQTSPETLQSFAQAVDILMERKVWDVTMVKRILEALIDLPSDEQEPLPAKLAVHEEPDDVPQPVLSTDPAMGDQGGDPAGTVIKKAA